MYFKLVSQLLNVKAFKMLMKRSDSLLLVIDVQERLAPAMDSPREVITGCARLIGTAKELGVPFVIAEQNPKGLGATMVDLRQAAGEEAVYLPKMEFSCAANPALMTEIIAAGKKQVIIAGVEAHICVLQTAIELKDRGYEVFVVSDASSSRQPLQTIISWQRLNRHGIDVVSSEMVMYEWLETAAHPRYKEISKKFII